jgi:hypothetical protein
MMLNLSTVFERLLIVSSCLPVQNGGRKGLTEVPAALGLSKGASL